MLNYLKFKSAFITLELRLLSIIPGLDCHFHLMSYVRTWFIANVYYLPKEIEKKPLINYSG
jgi:hypothetical protein